MVFSLHFRGCFYNPWCTLSWFIERIWLDQIIKYKLTSWSSANVMRCAIWYHWCNLKNVKNTHGRILILVKLQAKACNFTKINTPPWVFFMFLNCTNSTKSRNKSQIRSLYWNPQFLKFMCCCKPTTQRFSRHCRELWETACASFLMWLGSYLYSIFENVSVQK